MLDLLEQLKEVISKGNAKESFQKNSDNIFQFICLMWSHYTQLVLDNLSTFSTGNLTAEKVLQKPLL